ncbi:MAG: efflux RND transporter periplasmic adaptor subunit [Alphaproteobacteria bacterium]|nr:efflux RND transporter periplasmic adaptor subunit [Alphaproteobacteria bacterium]
MKRFAFFRARALRPGAGLLGLGLALVICGGPAAAADQTTGAVGRITPASGVVGVFAAPASRVTAILVHTGQVVKAGTLLMRTQATTPDSDPDLARRQLKAAEELAVQQVAAQTATVALARSRYDQAKTALDTYKGMGSSITSKKEMSDLSHAAADAGATLRAEEARLRVAKAQSQTSLDVARRQAEAALAGTELRAPIDGTILKIARQVGEQVGGDPPIQMGDVRTMYVVCQIYEGDLLRLKPGMGATIRAQPLAQRLHGRIADVGRMVETQSRLGEVRIRLDRADPASRLVGMQVDVTINR